MNIFYGFEHKFERALVTVGSFDGVHKGHRLLIEQMNQKASQIGAQAVLITFDPHPRTVLRGANRLLSTIEERLLLLEQAGARNVVVVNFTPQFAQISADDFVQKYLIDYLGAVAIFIGEGHFFGKNRGGDENFLAKYPLQIFHLDRFDNISSTAVRAAIEGGDMAAANSLLGGGYLAITPVNDTTKLLPTGGKYRCADENGEKLELYIDDILNLKRKKKLYIFEKLEY